MEDLALDGMIILKWITNEQDTMAWTELIWLRVGMSDICKHGNEPSGSISCAEVLHN